MSRVAMLDIHLAFWVVLGFLCLLLDRRWIDRRTERALADEPVQTVTVVGEDGATVLVEGRAGAAGRGRTRVPSPLWRPWRFASGAAMGAALCGEVVGAHGARGRRAAHRRLGDHPATCRSGCPAGGRSGGPWAWRLLGLILAFLVVPAIVYMATWLPWFNHFGWSLSAWWENQKEMWRYHANLTEFAYDSKTDTFTPTHGSYSKAWTWILMKRPVNFFVENTTGRHPADPHDRQPALFWGTVFAIPYCACGVGAGPATGVRASW